MNNGILQYLQKAALTACLFLFTGISVSAQSLGFKPSELEAYKLVLTLQTDKARHQLESPTSSAQHYVASLSEAFELLLTEDLEKFGQFESNFERRLDQISGKSADELFLEAELRLQWAFVYLKFGHEFDAALQLRKAYSLTSDVRKKYSSYEPVLKTSGLLNVMIGSVPEKYNWVLDLLDMRGDVAEGLSELEKFRLSPHPMAKEATLWYAFIQGFILQNPDKGISALEEHLLSPEVNNPVAMFLAANLYAKNSNSEKALNIVNDLDKQKSEILLPSLSYLKGELLLHKGDYESAITSFDLFLRIYKGQNYVKDALYKTGICYWLNGKEADARKRFEEARVRGKEATETDKHASKALGEHELPSMTLTKARYFTDGGYYAKAFNLLNSIGSENFSRQKDKIEFEYRKARLFHKTNDITKAKHYYKLTIEVNGTDGFYFAPNACLQLGYIAMDEKEIDDAKQFFLRALSYKKHEYKNSIDSKARSALSQLQGRK